jgi:hypothetical protein
MQVNVDPIEQRTRDPRQVPVHPDRAAAAFVSGITEVPTRAGMRAQNAIAAGGPGAKARLPQAVQSLRRSVEGQTDRSGVAAAGGSRVDRGNYPDHYKLGTGADETWGAVAAGAPSVPGVVHGRRQSVRCHTVWQRGSIS